MIIDPTSFKAPYIPQEMAWKEADRIRERYWPSGSLPVEIEEILWGLELRLIPLASLRECGDVDALLRMDLPAILVDQKEYMDDRMQNRIRFSIAHEVGRFILHADI